MGGDRTWGSTLSNYIAGTLDEVAVYPKVLTEQDVRDHYTAAGRSPLNRPPVAAFTATTDDLKVDLDASASTDPDGPVSYAWDFGDGATGTGETTSHTYAAAGTYTVQLTVTDGPGLTDSETHDVTVVANQPPTADFSTEVDDLKSRWMPRRPPMPTARSPSTPGTSAMAPPDQGPPTPIPTLPPATTTSS